MARVALRATAVVQLDGSGNGFTKIGPLSAREVWYPTNVSVSTLTHVKESTCDIFVGQDTSQSNFRDESVLGSTGDSSGTISADVITSGMYVWAVWTGADANTQGVLTVTGIKDV